MLAPGANGHHHSAPPDGRTIRTVRWDKGGMKIAIAFPLAFSYLANSLFNLSLFPNYYFGFRAGDTERFELASDHVVHRLGRPQRLDRFDRKPLVWAPLQRREGVNHRPSTEADSRCFIWKAKSTVDTTKTPSQNINPPPKKDLPVGSLKCRSNAKQPHPPTLRYWLDQN